MPKEISPNPLVSANTFRTFFDTAKEHYQTIYVYWTHL